MAFVCFNNKRRDKIKNSVLFEGSLPTEFNLYAKYIPFIILAN